MQDTRPDQAGLSLSDVLPFAKFARQCEQRGIATEQQLRWYARYRNDNGLAAAGAIVEKRPNPKQSKKPMLFVVVPRFVEWLSSNKAAQQ